MKIVSPSLLGGLAGAASWSPTKTRRGAARLSPSQECDGFIREVSRRCGGSVPFSLLPHASWATPRVAPMIRMALTHAVRRGLARSIHAHWRRGDVREVRRDQEDDGHDE